MLIAQEIRDLGRFIQPDSNVPGSANPEFTGPPEPGKPFTERYRWLRSTIVSVAALWVGLFLASLLRQIRQLLPPPGAQ